MLELPRQASCIEMPDLAEWQLPANPKLCVRLAARVDQKATGNR